MVGLVEPPVPPPLGAGFSVAQQKVHLDIDFLFKRIRGKTDITIIPHSTDLKTITFNSRQANITRLSINNRVAPATFHHDDPYEHTQLRWESGVNQHHMLQERLQKWTKTPSEHEIVLTLPPKFKITGAPPMNIVDNLNKSAEQADLSQNTKNVLEQAAQFNPITIYIEYTVENIRDGMNFVGWVPEDLRYPHAYTLNSSTAQVACCLFPCIDSIDSKCTWDIQIRTPRTLGDALGDPIQNSIIDTSLEDRTETPNGHRDDSRFSAEDRALDLIVVCSGDMTDEIVDPLDSSKKTTSFSCTKPVSAQHIGFAIGPFEAVNLAAFRESDEDDKLGRNAIPIHAFCLPGRADEVKNTCLPMAKAMDYFVITYGSYPFSSYKLCFVDDIVLDQFNTYSLSLCSNRLLFPPEILNPMDSVTRTLIFGLACQWIGVNVTPREPTDLWVVVGIAFFITDMFLRKLSGNNEYRYQQKRNADRVCDMDKARPSIFDSGRHISLDPTHYELISAKAPLVLFILDRRLTKASGSTGLSRSISRIFLNATVGDLPDSTLSTAYFTKTVERLSHSKLEPFFNQWVYGAGCPYFRVTQRFNKKRLVVEMTIHQVQQESTASNIQTENFIRDVKEDAAEVYAGQPQHVFTGPMTIRIHEADGIPYEHIIDIRDAKTTVEIPYNTKYKRLKRSRRHREKLIASGGADVNLDGQEEGVLYSLGEILQSEEEMRDWQLAEWSKDDEDKISGESYEWIRMDADFEWICRTVTNMPGYMYISQLQQDRDVVAQYETIQYLATSPPHYMTPTVLVRTLMDDRYFHGLRSAAASALGLQARDEFRETALFHLDNAFHELFCLDSRLTRPNNFAERSAYNIQCAIPKAIARIRDSNGRAPFSVRRFLYEKLRYNDNSNNPYSDCYYLATLMKALAESMASVPPPSSDLFDPSDPDDNFRFHDLCLEEIDRYRRLDEWIPTYHNVLSTTALECNTILAQAGSVPKQLPLFLQYTQEGGYDDLRVVAFASLMELGAFKNDHVLKWFLFVLGTDSSPYMRFHMFRLFGKVLGTIAIGEDSDTAEVDRVPQEGNLVVQESSTEARQADLARKQTVSGATTALKAELSGRQSLEAPLWDAVCSQTLTIREVAELLTVCGLLYEPVTSCIVKLKMPRYWRATNMGPFPPSKPNGKPRYLVKFTQTKRVRLTPIPKRQPVPQAPLPKREGSVLVAPMPIKKMSLKPPKKPPASPVPPVPSAPIGEGRPTIKLKLKLPGTGGMPGAGGAQTPR